MPLGGRQLVRRLADVGARVVDEDVESPAPLDRLGDDAAPTAASVTSTATANASDPRACSSRTPRLALVGVACRHHHAAPAPPARAPCPRPMPPLPPVTIATRDFRSNTCSPRGRVDLAWRSPFEIPAMPPNSSDRTQAAIRAFAGRRPPSASPWHAGCTASRRRTRSFGRDDLRRRILQMLARVRHRESRSFSPLSSSRLWGAILSGGT